MDALAGRIAKNLEDVNIRIERSAVKSDRKPEEVRLIVVTKMQPVEVIQSVIAAGVRNLGENYPEESLPKIESFKDTPGITWHMIGHLQSRKSRLVAENFDMLHSLDSLHLAEKLERVLAEAGKMLPVLIEVNVSGEESKNGISAGDPVHWSELLALIGPLCSFPHIQIRGLMTMPPLFDEPAQARPYFLRLRELLTYLARQLPQHSWSELSMGTSADYEIAIEEGATMVRIGQAILGPRPARQ